VFKLLLVGEMGVGKSTFIKRLASESFSGTYQTTNSVDVIEMVFFTNHGAIQFDIVDGLAGISDPTKREDNYRGGQCAIIMFDVTSPVSYRRVPLWHRDIKKVCDEIPMVMCANKIDRDDRKVKMEQLRSDLPCFETSVKKYQDVQSPFLAIARMMLGRADIKMVCPPRTIPKVLQGNDEEAEKRRASMQRFKELMDQYYSALFPGETSVEDGDKHVPGRLCSNRLSLARPTTSRNAVAHMSVSVNKQMPSLTCNESKNDSITTAMPPFKPLLSQTSSPSALQKSTRDGKKTLEDLSAASMPSSTENRQTADTRPISTGRRGSLAIARASITRAHRNSASLELTSLPGQVTPQMLHHHRADRIPLQGVNSAEEYEEALRTMTRKSLAKASQASNKRRSVTLAKPPMDIATREELEDAMRKSEEIEKQRAIFLLSAEELTNDVKDANGNEDKSEIIDEVEDQENTCECLVKGSGELVPDVEEIAGIVGVSTAVVEFIEVPSVEAAHAALEIGGKTHLAVAEAERDQIDLLNNLDDEDANRATVFGGEWFGTSVAVKFIRCSSKEEVETLYGELATVSTMHHPRLAAVMAVCKDLDPSEGTVALLTEFLDRGSLYSILHDTSPAAMQLRPKTVLHKLHMCSDIVAAMRFLRNHRLNHHNLKSHNILIDNEGRPKLTDFGMKSLNSYALGKARSIAWTAPEVLKGGDTDEKADVYSFGVVVWEIFTCSIPWENAATDKIIDLVVDKGQRLPIPKEGQGIPTTVLDLLLQCFGPAQSRMTFDELAKTLKDIESAEKANPTDTQAERPLSHGTMHQQLQFLRAKFLSGEEDELEWLMVSKEAGAYKYAHNKLGEAEDKYYKALAEMENSEQKIEATADFVTKCTKQFNDCIRVREGIESGEVDAQNTVKLSQKVLQGIITMDALNPDQKLPSVLSYFSDGTKTDMLAFVDESNLLRATEIADNCKSKALPEEKRNVQRAVAQLQKDADLALRDIERWTKREKDCDDYATCMEKEELEWLDRERSANEESLAIMRSYIPIGVQNMTVDELKGAVMQKGGMFSTELLLELKKNKCLHWFVTHTQDIAMSNFLMGDLKQYFENLEGMDIVELRALACVVPGKFELDGDGRKQDWRARMMAKLKQLVMQENGEMVRGGWNAAKGERTWVQLAPLKPQQQRRSVYSYPTKVQCDLKVKQFGEKQALFEKKRAALIAIEGEYLDSKTEYDIILTEMRDQDIKNTYGADQLLRVKDMAKQQLASVSSIKKKLEDEVKRIDKQMKDSPITMEQFKESMDDLNRFLQRKGINYFDAKAPVKIEGVFDREPLVTKAKREVAKMLSPEEEAARRKTEIAAQTRQRQASIESKEEANECQGADEEKVPGGHQPVRKLSNANLAMVERLKTIFPDQSSKSKPIPKMCTGRAKKEATGDAEPASEEKKDEPKMTKVSRSKLLLGFVGGENSMTNILGMGSSEDDAKGGGGMVAMSMMEQIKAQKALKCGGRGGVGSMNAGDRSKEMSMMEQIKARKAGKLGSLPGGDIGGGGIGGGGMGGGGVSMLDMIKARRVE
jgi:GTP-binding nuclear protein Ran